MYLTSARLFSLVTAMPLSARPRILVLDASTFFSAMTSRQRRSPLQKASFSFSPPVSMFTKRSTGRIGWGQAISSPNFPRRDTPKSSHVHSPESSSSFWPVKAVTCSR